LLLHWLLVLWLWVIGLGSGDGLLVVGELLLLLLLDADEDDSGTDEEEKNQATDDGADDYTDANLGFLLAATASAVGERGRLLEVGTLSASGEQIKGSIDTGRSAG
jgi:hypothetical protein